MTDYAAGLRAIIKKHDDDIMALAAQYRQKVIVPVCRKYKLRFVSGMGTFFFCPLDKNDDQMWHTREELTDRPLYPRQLELSEKAKAVLGPILDVLNEDVTNNSDFGHWVFEVR